MKSISLDAIITSIRSKVDKSIAFSVSTPELTQDEVAQFFQIQGMNVNLLITPTDTETKDIHEVKSELQSKTQSQRLRGVLYVLLEQTLGRKPEHEEWETYYRQQTDKIIEYLKNKLE